MPAGRQEQQTGSVAVSPVTPITIDLVAQDASGRPLDTLAATDFVVAGRTASPGVAAARFVRATGVPAADQPRPIAPGEDDHAGVDASTRLFAIFLDEFHVTPGPRVSRVRDALVRFVRDDLGPSDLLAVVKPLDSRLEIRATRDRAAALGAIESFDPRRGDYGARTPFERTYIAASPARIDNTRAQIATSLLEALATYLGRFPPARKTLIVVSEGFSRAGRERGDGLLPGVESVALAANRAGVAIYPVDPVDAPGGRDAAPAPRAQESQREVLRSLSEITGGRTIAGADAVGGGLKRAMADASGYYVLTLTPPDPVGDGRLHPVDISVRRAGVSVRARKGYWVPSPPGPSLDAIHASVALPYASQFPRRASPLIRPWFGMARGGDDHTRVSFVWEPAPPVAGERRRGLAPSRVVLSVTKLDGTPVFEGVVSAAGAGLSSGVSEPRAHVSFEAPAGRLLVQMRIEDAASTVVDRDIRDLVVREFAGPVSIGSAGILRARNARDAQALAADPNAAPVAARQFSRSERLIVRVSVASDGEAPAVTARLLSAIGGVMRPLAVVAAPSRPSEYQTDVSLAGLAVGTYSVEVSAATSRGDAREVVAFRVTP